MMEQIRLNQLNKIYQGKNYEVKALSEVNISISKGEMLAVMGPSGSGKTTLLNILGLIDRPSSGSYLLDGQDVSALRDKELARLRNRKFGFVLQDFGLIEQYTVEKNIQLPMHYSEIPRKQWRKRVKEVLNSVGIAEKEKNYPSELSGGQKQRVAIARALIAQGEILLADEPTGALDSKTSEEIMRLFLDIKEQGKTIIVVTHDANVAKHCDRTLIIKDGEMSLAQSGRS